MVTRNLSIRLATQNGKVVARELQDIGRAGEQALKRIEQAGVPASNQLQALSSVVGGLKRAFAVAGTLAAGNQIFDSINRAVIKTAELGDLAQSIGINVERLQELRYAAEQSGASAELLDDGIRKLNQRLGDVATDGTGAAAGAFERLQIAALNTDGTIRNAGDVFDEFVQKLESVGSEAEKAALASDLFGKQAGPRLVQLLSEGEAGISSLSKEAHAFGVVLGEDLVKQTQALEDEWNRFTQQVDTTYKTVILRTVNGLRGLFSDPSLDEQFRDLTARLQRATADLNASQQLNNDSDGLLGGRRIAQAREEVNRIKAELDSVQRQILENAATETAKQRKKEEAQKAYEAARKQQDTGEVIDTLQREQQQIEQLNAAMIQGADAVARVKGEQAAETQIRKLGIDAKSAEAQKIRELAVANAALEQAGREQAEAQKSTVDARASVIRSLEDERQALLLNERQQFVLTAERRLSSEATATQRERVRELAGALYDEKTALEATKKAQEDYAKNQEILARLEADRSAVGKSDKEKFTDQAVERLSPDATDDQKAKAQELAAKLYEEQQAADAARQVFETTRNDAEKYGAEITKLNDLLAKGAIDQDTYNRAVAQASETFHQAEEGSNDFATGAKRALEDYAKSATDVAGQVQDAMSRSLQGLEDSLVDFVTTGKLNFQDLANSILRDLARIAVRQAITAPLAQGLLGAGIFHEGGTVGAGAPSRAVSPMLFATAPRYHSGGIAGLMPDEVPAILQRGEVVIPREQAGKTGGSSSPVINMTIVTRDAESFRQSRGQIMGDLAVSLARHKGRNT
jgi:lambda family phage tail tape measure protein